MPKSYKVCPIREFSAEKFANEPFKLKAQYVLSDVAAPPQSVIYRARDQVSYKDFDSYVIEHEREVSVRGRVNGHAFEKFIRQGTMKAFFSGSANLLLITGKKDDILDFCKATANLSGITLATIRVDMKALLARLAQVSLVWFRFPSGLIRASALMGNNVQKTDQFAQAHADGDISTLSFFLETELGMHQIMVTADGAVVLQDEYKEVADELETVLKVKTDLLDGIYSEEEIRAARKAAK